MDIDEDSLEQFGQWPWRRDRLAGMADRLSPARRWWPWISRSSNPTGCRRALQDPPIYSSPAVSEDGAEASSARDDGEIFAEARKRGNVGLRWAPLSEEQGAVRRSRRVLHSLARFAAF